METVLVLIGGFVAGSVFCGLGAIGSGTAIICSLALQSLAKGVY